MILFTIGRELNNKYIITKSDDPNRLTSNNHAEIYIRDDGSISIIDKSANGTTVNNRKIDREIEVDIKRGDKIVFAGVHQLNWSKVPSVTPPPPGWNIYSIGTAFNNRIQLNDPTNNVSRFHATLKIDPKGKMFINDHSTNGTFVNGNRIQTNQDYPVKRKDNIRFANTQLNWNSISAKSSFPLVTFLSSVAALLIIAFGILGYKNGLYSSVPEPKEMTSEQIFSKYSNSVVVVAHSYNVYAVYRNEKKLLYSNTVNGTAFFIDSIGTMLTNRHMTLPWENEIPIVKKKLREGFWKIGQSYSDNITEIIGETEFIGIALNHTDIKTNLEKSDFIECAVIAKNSSDESADVGLIKTKSPSLPNSNIKIVDIKNTSIDLKKENYTVGRKIYVLGYPLGIKLFGATKSGTTNTMQVKLTCQEGNINSDADAYKFGVSVQMTHGASGSPVFDVYGQFLGVFYAGFDETQGLNYAILAKHGKKLYDEIH